MTVSTWASAALCSSGMSVYLDISLMHGYYQQTKFPWEFHTESMRTSVAEFKNLTKTGFPSLPICSHAHFRDRFQRLDLFFLPK